VGEDGTRPARDSRRDDHGRYALVAALLAALTVAGAIDARAADDPAPLADGGSVSEPPAAPAPGGAPRSVKLWPLFEYESDPAAGSSHLRILGPVLEYRSDPQRQAFAFRPFVSISQSRVGHDDDVHILYPLLSSHWGQTDQVTTGFGGLFTYRTRTSEDGVTLESQDARILPVYVYAWDRPEAFGRFSVAPLYADVEHLLGYERVQMVMFPAYVRVQRAELDRHYYLFPLITRDGPPGSGYRLWPFPLRDRHGRRIEHHAAAAAAEPHTFFPQWREELDAADPPADRS
jgi:hypothetical protein